VDLMKLSKEELKAKISEKVTDPDLSIELLEDVEDSFTEEGEVDNTELEDLKEKYSNLQERYKARFLSGSEEDEEESKEDVPELEEKEIVDIKEI
jgi:ElaB/YqjD/DUF883 family membrane-anchored ribosome-binding protein